MRTATAIFLFLAAHGLFAQTITTNYTARLVISGGDDLAPLVADAIEPEIGLTPALHVTTPNAAVPRIIGFVNPSISIPFNSRIRQLEASWNGTPLPLIDPTGTGIVEEAHSYGSMIPFFKPLFSVAAISPGPGTLQIHGFDSAHTEVATVSIPNLTIVAPPQPIASSAIAAISHPRIWLTPARLAAIHARAASDPAAMRFDAVVQQFLDALAEFPDVTSPEFEDRIYDPEDYIPLLALTYQLRKTSDPASAAKCAAAAHTLTVRIATEYDNGTRDFGRDTGYDIRFGLRELMLAYDWMYDQFTPAERALIVRVSTNWIDWYHTNPGYVESWPVENYYAGYLQGMALTIVATAGDSDATDRFLTLLRTKLTNEVPVMNDRLAGGDWSEGWNYGPLAVTEFSLVNTLLRDLGEDWSADFDWLQTLPRSMTYQVAPDFSETRSYGGYSGDYPHKTSPEMLAVLSTTTTDGALAARLYRNTIANPNNDFADVGGERYAEMIFAPADSNDVSVASMPLSYMNSGTGRFFARSSLTDTNAYFVSAENTGYSYDHYGYANGDVRLYHGDVCLLCPSAYRGDDFDGEATTPAFSTFLVDGNEQGEILGRNNQTLFSFDRGSYAAVGMRFESSYTRSRYDEDIVDGDSALDYLIREVVYLRPGTLVVRDLSRRRHASDTLTGRWHIGVLDPATMVPHPGETTAFFGSFAVSWAYPSDVTVSFVDDHDAGNNRIGTVMQFDFASSTAPKDLVTVFSETTSLASYANGVATLGDGTRITFANGDVSVQAGTAHPRRRAVN